MASLADYPDACTVGEVYEDYVFAFRQWVDKEADHVKEWWFYKDHDGNIFLKIIGEWKEGSGYGRSFLRYPEVHHMKNGGKIRKWHKINLPKDFIVGIMGTEWVYYDQDWNLDDRWSPLNIELRDKYGEI